MADVVRGIAEVAPNYATKYPVTNPGAKKFGRVDKELWNGFADEAKKASDDLRNAITNIDEKAFKKAVNNLNHSCNACHTNFRD